MFSYTLGRVEKRVAGLLGQFALCFLDFSLSSHEGHLGTRQFWIERMAFLLPSSLAASKYPIPQKTCIKASTIPADPYSAERVGSSTRAPGSRLQATCELCDLGQVLRLLEHTEALQPYGT